MAAATEGVAAMVGKEVVASRVVEGMAAARAAMEAGVEEREA